MSDIGMTDIKNLNEHLDQYLMAPTVTEEETINGCNLAHDLRIDTVWVKPCYVRTIVNLFHRSPITIGTMVGYPYGANTTYVKMAETKRALTEGVTALGVVINIADLIAGREAEVFEHVKCVLGLAHMNAVNCQIVLDNAFLDDRQIQSAAKMAEKTGASGIGVQFHSKPNEDALSTMKLLRSVLGHEFTLSAFMPGLILQNEIDDFLMAGCNHVGMYFRREELIDPSG
jgi:deoxyribose-phosphate aldolase